MTGEGGGRVPPEPPGAGCYARWVLRRLSPRSVWLLAAAPFVLVGVGSRALVSRVGDAMVAPLVEAAAVMHAASKVDAVVGAKSHAAPSVVAGGALPAVGGAERSLPRIVAAAHAAPAPREKGASAAHLFIAIDRLMKLSAARLRAVHWVAVRDGRGAPAGVRLSGVGALGVGLADGDVVTSIDGKPTRTEDDATAAGVAAWTSGEAALHATIVRKDQVVAVTVELPPRG